MPPACVFIIYFNFHFRLLTPIIPTLLWGRPGNVFRPSFHKPAGQAGDIWLKAIWVGMRNLLRVPAITRLLFAKVILGPLTTTNEG